MNWTRCSSRFFVLAALVWMGCGEHRETEVASGRAAPGSTLPQYVDVTTQAGIDFVHTNGASGRFYYVETYGSGAAFVDYDSDGDEDLYLVNSAALPGFTKKNLPANALYRNRGDGTFEDATAEAGGGDRGYGMGVCAGDYDNDGAVDLYVTNFGANVLYANSGNGRLADESAAAGVADGGLSTSAAFADIDNDGDLDLYVANNAELDLNSHRNCTEGDNIPAYCSPLVHNGASGTLYRNGGDGAFEDATRPLGLHRADGRQLGVVFGDYDADGDVDLYVANDMTPNFLFRNNGKGVFTQVGLLSGAGLNEDARPEAGMGTDFGDYDRDGLLDIVVCNFQWESCRLFENQGRGLFADVTFAARLGEPTLSTLTFGTDFLDYDNDGYLDLFLANGHVHSNVREFDRAASYAQRDQLFHNNGDGTFTDVSTDSPGLAIASVGRGAATADYDNDGDLDLCVANNNQPSQLLRNDGGNRQHWLAVRTVGTHSNRDGIGARIEVVAGDLHQVEEVRSGSSYLSQNALRVHFGLGTRTRVERLVIRWPSGVEQVLQDVAVDQCLTVQEPAKL